tara:strand:+ start:179 stop:430 length:252 start_codon:yes stop_codon:yes gene_type:complete
MKKQNLNFQYEPACFNGITILPPELVSTACPDITIEFPYIEGSAIKVKEYIESDDKTVTRKTFLSLNDAKEFAQGLITKRIGA